MQITPGVAHSGFVMSSYVEHRQAQDSRPSKQGLACKPPKQAPQAAESTVTTRMQQQQLGSCSMQPGANPKSIVHTCAKHWQDRLLDDLKHYPRRYQTAFNGRDAASSLLVQCSCPNRRQEHCLFKEQICGSYRVSTK